MRGCKNKERRRKYMITSTIYLLSLPLSSPSSSVKIYSPFPFAPSLFRWPGEGKGEEKEGEGGEVLACVELTLVLELTT